MKRKNRYDIAIMTMDELKARFWTEVARYENGVFLHTVTCTEDNIENLHRSQFPNSGVYNNSIYRYV